MNVPAMLPCMVAFHVLRAMAIGRKLCGPSDRLASERAGDDAWLTGTATGLLKIFRLRSVPTILSLMSIRRGG